MIAIRNPFALIVRVKLILPLIIAFLHVSCEKGVEDAVAWNNKKTIIELQNRIELLRYQADQLAPKEQHQVSAADEEALHEEMKVLLSQKRNLNKEISQLRSGWDEHRKNVLENRRISVSGKTFEAFNVSDGRQFQDAKVTQIDDTGVSMTHADGTARLRYDDLSPQWHSYFGLDGEFAHAAQEQETGQRIAYEREMDRQLAAISMSEADQRKERNKEEKEERLASARAIASSTRAAASRPLSASVGALGETSTFYTSRYRNSFYSYYRRPIVRYNYTNYCPPSHSHIPFWNSSSYRSGTGGCVRPISNPIPFFQPNP